jgi:hypothetical protein
MMLAKKFGPNFLERRLGEVRGQPAQRYIAAP